jgi:hypothetical protein
MNDFWIYFEVGWEHITDLNGIDHILFVAALCLRYQLTDWRKLLILITAFTFGHSITLALSVFEIVSFSTSWIEFLIPVTICITAFSNGLKKSNVEVDKFPLIYYLALFFGLIFVTLLQINKKTFLLFVSGGIFALALQMAIERFYAL